MHDTASPLVFWGILVIAVAMAVVLAVAASRSVRNLPAAFIAVAAWMALTAGAALSGVLANFDARPPPMALMFVVTIAAGIALGLSRVGRDLAQSMPLFALVGVHAFRLPLEVVMHEAAREGTMPNAMTFTGYNFDIVTGALALLVGLVLYRFLPRMPSLRALAWLVNIVGITMLAVIAVVSFIASPIVRGFGDDPRDVNTWVAYFPFVWLPTVLVLFAIAGHVILTRALLRRAPVRAH